MSEKKNKHGIKETKELLVGVFAVTSLLIERFRDGAGYDDAIAIISKLVTDNHFQSKLLEAINGLDELGNEVEDLSIEELVELSAYLVPEVLSVIANIPEGTRKSLDNVVEKSMPELKEKAAKE